MVTILKNDHLHLRIDATYFKQFCVMCYQDNDTNHTQLIRFCKQEDYSEIKEDLENLIKLGLRIESITSDGHKSILKAIKNTMPDVKVQRCLVHIQRMCLLWLTRYPKHESGKALRALVLQIMNIKTENDRLDWVKRFYAWYELHKTYINTKTYHANNKRYWYKHKLLRRSYSTIKNALPNMFHYIQNANIPNTNNGIEGYFSHLKNHLDVHRGLTIKHRMDFIKWYVYLKNTESA